MLLALLLVQADPAIVSTKPTATSWSILEPIANEPCRPADAKRNDGDGDDIIVCALPIPSQKLPYPGEVVPNGPRPSNPHLTGTGALDAGASCAAESRGCTVGFGPPIMPIVAGVVDVAGRMFAKKPDKTGRVPIQLKDMPPKPSVILP